MFRTALLLAALMAACGGNGPGNPDARSIDAHHAIDAAGSGSATAMAMEASPHDHNLDVMVVALGMVIVAGPVRRSKRRDAPRG